jgi:HPt (histidine-containing phosphotransfer) domain-containing protein
LRAAGIEEVADSILATFVDDSPVRMSQLEEAVAARDADAILSAAHAFKSGASTIRATLLAELLQDTEDAARRGRRELIGMLEQIRTEYAAVRRQLTTLLHNAA